MSDLYRQAHRLPKRVVDVDGVGVNFYIIGDPAYPLLDWLLKGYTRAQAQTPEQESFSVHLSAARTCVEMAFGRVKARWRILLKRNDLHYTFCPYLVITCCALHNFCEREKEPGNLRWMQEAAQIEVQFPQPGNPPINNANENGQAIREALKDYSQQPTSLYANVL
ncbi:hypothetical protein NL108_009852 [Boleophthalmus pectinirostris]|nr:hypothetical protein NL108_009852 [Boleophthalmus pectinirostris]